MEQLRDDPYYLIDDTPKPVVLDVDAIPIVRLEDMPSISGVFDSLPLASTNVNLWKVRAIYHPLNPHRKLLLLLS